MDLFDKLTGSGDLGSITDLISKNPRILGAAKSLLDPDDASVGGGSGLMQILDKLRASGLGEQVASWLGSGKNLPVSGEQISGALGDGILGQFAEKAGLDLGDAAKALAEVLPGLVDKLSPGGSEPDGASLGGLLGSF